MGLDTLVLVFLMMCSVSGGYEVNDEHLYKVTWQASDPDSNPIDTLPMQTSRGEKYECSIPPLGLRKTESHHNYTNNLKDVLNRLFKSHPCSARVEYYWTYEICHNKHIRQFHEEQLPGKGNIAQEYFLGFPPPEINVPETISSKPPEILLGEVSYPYFKVDFVNGTMCDLTNTGRSTSVLYICHEGIDGGIVQISELESCKYQLVFATKYLCAFTAYTVRKRSSLAVTCTPQAGVSIKPSALVEFETENEKQSSYGISNLAALFGSVFKHIQIDAERRDNTIVYHIRAVNPQNELQTESDSGQDSSTVDRDPTITDNDFTGRTPTSSNGPRMYDHSRAATTSQLLAFLRGQFCLTGHQTGWWTHELCFGKNVTQFHQVAHGKRAQIIVLGYWDRQSHDEWVGEHPNLLKPSPNNLVTQRSHVLFYGGGEYCPEIGDTRYALVKLRCDLAANGIYLSFSEQSTCRYSILVESAAFCDMSDEDWHTLVL